MTWTFAFPPRLAGAWWGAALLAILAFSGLSAAQDSPPVDGHSPDPALRDYFSANGLLNRGMYELAVPEYQKFIREHSNHEKAPLAYYGLGVAYLRLERSGEALKALDAVKVTADFPFAMEIAVMRGQLLIAGGRFEDAAVALKSAAANDVEHDLADDAGALLVEADYRAGDMKVTVEAGKAFAQRWPSSPLAERTALFTSLALIADGDDARAIDLLNELVEGPANGPYRGRATLLLAQCLQRQARTDDAEARYRQVIERNEDPVTSEAIVGLASMLLDRGSSIEAGELLDQLKERAGDQSLSPQALMLQGRVLLDDKQYDDAAEAFETAGQRDAAQRDAAEFWLAKCDLRAGRNAQAAQRLLEAMKAHPQSALLVEMAYDRAVALMRDGNTDAALRALSDFLKRNSSHSLAPDAMHMQATLEHEQTRYDASIDLCREFLRLFPDHTLSANMEYLRAENEFMAGRLAEAAQQYGRFVASHPEHARVQAARLRQGTALYRLEQYDEAERVLATVATGLQTPESMRSSLLMLGDIAYRNKQWVQAAQALDEYLQLIPSAAGADDALLKRSLAQIQLDRKDVAIAGLTLLIDEHRDSPHGIQAYFERGQLLSTSDEKAASLDLEKVLEIDARSRFAPYALNMLAAMALRQGRVEDAAALFAKAGAASDDAEFAGEAGFQHAQALIMSNKFADAATVLDQFIRKYADHQRIGLARAHLIIALSRSGDMNGALRAFDSLDSDVLDSIDADTRASVHYERAWCLRELGRNDQAITAYRELLDARWAGRLTAPASLELADLLAGASQCEQAIALLEPLVTSERGLTASNSADATLQQRALFRLASCLYETKQFEKAVAVCERFLAEAGAGDAVVISAHVMAGESCFALGRHAKAVPHFRAIVERPKDDPARAASMLRLGECLASTGDWKASEAVFAQHRSEYAESEVWFQAQFGRAWALENQNRHADAIAAYRVVIERHNGPTAARAQFQIGECLFAQKKHEEAARELLKVDILYAYPEWSAAALYEAGRCFEAMSKPDEARAQFAQVQSKYGDSRWADLAAQRLAAISPATGPGG